MKKLVAIIGPTASGKTALAEHLALSFNGEIISADAKQVYRGMDIGTAKDKNLRVPQYLIDIKNPGEKVTVAEYQALAYATIEDVLARGKQPFLVGGSMLYAESVINGYEFSGGQKSDLQHPRYTVLKLGIELGREILKQKAALRLQQRVEEGLVEEVRQLLDQGVSPSWLESCGIEYRYFSQYVLGKISLETAINQATTAINQYIKRQYTWWRRHSDVVWLTEPEAAVEVVARFLN